MYYTAEGCKLLLVLYLSKYYRISQTEERNIQINYKLTICSTVSLHMSERTAGKSVLNTQKKETERRKELHSYNII
jgi:hypothetical protein